MATKYEYNIANDFLNGIVATDRLSQEIRDSVITTALEYIATTSVVCDIWFKESLSVSDATTLTSIVEAHTGEILEETPPPTMSDGRPIVRADSRPFGYQTYYTMAGDDSTAGIGEGKHLMWDWTDSTSDIVTGDHVPNGMKCKEFILTFLCPVYTKDGAIYFFDAPWGCYLMMDIAIPPGEWYPNPAGAVPALALGLSGDTMYANTGANWVSWASYIMKYRIHGSCPMGDELNAEGSSVDPVPPGWGIRGRVYTPISDNESRGFAEIELHRCHTAILPGQTVQDIIDAH